LGGNNKKIVRFGDAVGVWPVSIGVISIRDPIIPQIMLTARPGALEHPTFSSFVAAATQFERCACSRRVNRSLAKPPHEGFSMSRSIVAAALALLASAMAHGQQPVTGTIAFKNVNVVPMDAARVLRDQTVIVENGRITRVGSAASATAPRTRPLWMAAQVPHARTHRHAHPPGGGTGAPGDNVAQELALLVANG
jgi:hypothetical protein